MLLENEKGFIVHEASGREAFKVGINTLWKNGSDFENTQAPKGTLAVDPKITLNNEMDFSLGAPALIKARQGLSDPQAVHAVGLIMKQRFEQQQTNPGEPKQ